MKNKVVAFLLAFFLGGFGAHKFYLGKTGQGIAYILLSWTFIPAIVALLEGIMYLTMSDKEFNKKYGNSKAAPYYTQAEVVSSTPKKENKTIAPTADKAIKYCPNCGDENDVNNKFCESCGTKL